MAEEFDPMTLADAALSLFFNPLGAGYNLLAEGDPFKQGREMRETVQTGASNVQKAIENRGGKPAEEAAGGGIVEDIGAEQAKGLREDQRRAILQSAREEAQEKADRKRTSALMATQGGFQEGGAAAFQAQQALVGLLGPEAQQAAIAQLQSSPQFQALIEQGQRGILANASATGGVRGGNTAAALAQFNQQALSNIINQQYQQLMGMSGLGAQAGQGLVGAGLSREQEASAAQRFYDQMAAAQSAQAGAALAGGRLGQLNYEQALRAQEQNQQLGWASMLTPLAGTAIGALFGGPAGAAVGGQVGSAMQSAQAPTV